MLGANVNLLMLGAIVNMLMLDINVNLLMLDVNVNLLMFGAFGHQLYKQKFVGYNVTFLVQILSQ